MRRSALVLPAALLVVVAVTFVAVRGLVHGAPHPGGDNAAYVALAHSLESGQGYAELWDPSARPHAKYPPVYPVMLAARIAIGGVTWQALKGVTVATALLLAFATLLWARGRAGVAVGAGVALLTALSTGILDYSRWVLSDVPFAALTVLALWAAERAQRGYARAREEGAPSADADADAPRARWLWPAALGLAGLAYFTRTAGLPLVVALFIALAFARNWRVLAGGALALGVPAGLWALRGLRAGPGVPGEDYVGSLWMLDPYDPAAGLAGPLDLLGRLAGNAVGYLTSYLPVGMVGTAEGAPRALAVALVLAGLAGWVLRLRARPGPTEFFVPLYVGLLLVWPEVWSGDRFALPLIPLLLLYAAEALRVGVRKVAPVAVHGALAAAGGLLLLTQVGAYGELAREAQACRGVVRVAGPYACFGAPMQEFAEAARWSAGHLPDDAAVLTRKPRIWYALSGLPSRTYPFSDDPEVLAASLERAEARYVVLDFVGGQGMRFLAPAITERPERFCVLAGFGGDRSRPGTQLLGVREPSPGETGPTTADGRTVLRSCGAGYARPGGADLPPYSSSSPIPILAPAS